MQFLDQQLLPAMNPFNGENPRSVLVMGENYKPWFSYIGMHGDAQYMHGHWFMKLLIMNDSRFKTE